MLSRWGCVAAIWLGLVLPAQAAERSGLVQRASCAVIRFYVAKYSADRRFYLLLTLLLLALASGEIAYGVFGPLSASTHQIDEFSSSNRVRW